MALSTKNATSMAATRKITKPAYQPYGIKSAIAQTSMKSLAAKAAANVNIGDVLKDQDRQKNPHAADKGESSSDKDDHCESSDDDIIEIVPQSSRTTRTSARAKGAADCMCIDEVKTTPKKKAPKKLIQKQKKAKESEEKRLADAQKARAQLLQALNAANNVDEEREPEIIMVEEPRASQKIVLPETKEHLVVVWKSQKVRFNLRYSASFQSVFEEMAVQMNTQMDKIVIFSSSDPSKTVNPLDRLCDIGSERLFNAAPKAQLASNPEFIPPQFKIKLNVQSVGSKVRIEIDVDKRAPLQKFMDSYCQRMGKKISDFRFEFCGDKLNPAQTADDLELVGDELFDAVPL